MRSITNGRIRSFFEETRLKERGLLELKERRVFIGEDEDGDEGRFLVLPEPTRRFFYY